MLAAMLGDSDIISTLIEKGVDIDAKSEVGMTALMMAARSGHLEATKALVEAGADLTIENEKGESAMIGAANRRQAETYEYLKKLDDEMKEKEEEKK